jgi:hypothetical protein
MASNKRNLEKYHAKRATAKGRRELRKKWYAQHLKRKYGIVPGTVAYYRHLQKSKCAICQKRKKLFVDHDHKTGEVRGLLCFRCNAGIGLFSESGTSLGHAILYLEKAKCLR